jgi:hypothetical protein
LAAWHNAKFGVLPWVPDHVSGGAAAFNPANLSNLQLYLNPTLGVTMDGSNRVSQWDDQSTNARHATQGTLSQQFVYTANTFGTQPGLVATRAASQFMGHSAFSGMTAFTMFLVYKPTTAVQSFQLSNAAGSGILALGNGAATDTEVYDGSVWCDFDDLYSAGTRYIYQLQSGAAPNASVLKRNGTSLNRSVAGASAWNMAQSLIGIRGGGTSPSNGAFGPIILYSGSKSDADCLLVYNWLVGDGWI